MLAIVPDGGAQNLVAIGVKGGIWISQCHERPNALQQKNTAYSTTSSAATSSVGGNAPSRRLSHRELLERTGRRTRRNLARLGRVNTCVGPPIADLISDKRS